MLRQCTGTGHGKAMTVTLTPEQQRMVGEAWDALHLEGWKWAELTNGERAKYGDPIKQAIRGLIGAGYVIEKREAS